MSTGDFPQRLPAGKERRFVVRPTTRAGKWAFGLAVAGVLLVSAWRLMGPLGGFPGVAFELAGGVVALIAIFRRGERALAVYAALLPFAAAVALVIGELVAS